MEDKKIISWIFLAIAMASKIEPANLYAISAIADGINHAVPTQKEFQIVIKWLSHRELISKKAEKYHLTRLGVSMMSEAEETGKSTFQLWSSLTAKLNNL